MNEMKPTHTLSWDKFKDVAILALVAFAIKIFQSNMDDLNKSVTELNGKMGVMVARTQINESEIMILRSNLRDLEIKMYSKPKK